MATFTRKYRGQMPDAVDKEFDQIIAALNVTIGAVMARCVAFHPTVQSLADSSSTPLSLAVTELDQAANMRLTISNVYIKAPVDGFYLVRGRAFFASGSGYRQLSLIKNSTTLAQTQRQMTAGAGGSGETMWVFWAGNLVATDTLRMEGYQVTGGALNVGSTSRELTNELVVIQLF